MTTHNPEDIQKSTFRPDKDLANDLLDTANSLTQFANALLTKPFILDADVVALRIAMRDALESLNRIQCNSGGPA